MRSFGLTIAVLAIMVGFVFGGMWLERNRVRHGKAPLVEEAEKATEKAIDKVYEDRAKKTAAATGGVAATKAPPMTAEQHAKWSQDVKAGNVPGWTAWAQDAQPIAKSAK